VFSLVKKWLGGAAPQRPDLHFLLYTRKGCHLCEDAWALLSRHRRRRGFTLEQVDVDTAPHLAAKYGDCVPVVAVNGAVRFRGRVNEVLLERILGAKP
jgi:glutaredoxin